MTDPRGVHAMHLDAATIAALVDRTLDPAARAAAEAHLAGCADCREVWMDTSEIAGEAQPLEGQEGPASIRHRKHGWWYGASAIAASAVLAAAAWSLIGGRTTVNDALDDLVGAVGTSRFSVARLSLPFEYGEPPAATRGSTGVSRPSLAVQREVIRLHELRDARRTADTLRGAGLAFLAVGDVTEAVAAFEEASDLAPETVLVDLSAALLERWRLTGNAHDVARALDVAEAAVLARPNDPAALFNRALALEGIGLRERAIAAWEEYLIHEPQANWRREGQSRLDALRAAAARETVEQTAFPSGGSTLTATSACASRAAESSGVWRSLYEDGDFAGARRQAILHRAARICEGLSTFEANMQLGLVELQLGDVRAAKALLEGALREAEAASHWEVAARAGIGLGIGAFREGDIGSGTRFLEAALAPAQASGKPYVRALAHSMLADTYQEHGDQRATWTHHVSAVEAVRGAASLRWKYTVLSGAALGARVAGLPGTALHFSEALLQQTWEWANPGGRIFAFIERAQARLSLGLLDGANADIIAGRALLTHLEEPLRSEFRAELATAEGRIAGTRQPAVAARAFGEALAVFEQRGNAFRRAGLLLERGRVWLASGDPAAAEEDWQEGVRLIEQEQRSISDRQFRVARLSHVWDLYDELIRLKSSNPTEALALLEEARAREEPGRPHAASRPTQDTPGAWLPADTVAYVYATLTDSLLIWRITRSEFTLTRRQMSASQLGRSIDEHLKQLDERGPRSGVDLAGLLLPAGRELPNESFARTLIIADGPLHRLPFSTLRLGPDRRPLVEWTEVAMAPSLRVAKSLSEACIPDHRKNVVLAGYGAADRDEGLSPLPAVSTELERIRRLHPDSIAFEGVAATPQAISARLESASLIHIAAHAVVDITRPSRSRLLLAPRPGRSGTLLASDIEALRLHGRPLVVLPACATAAGQIFRGEGAVSLSTPFLIAGASAVIGTMWAIQDTQAEWLMTRFHQALTIGTHPATALASVQRAASTLMPATAWSAFVYYGAPSKGSRTCPN